MKPPKYSIRYHVAANLAYLEIRVGEDEVDLSNNQICYEEIDLRVSGAADISCLQALFGDWISITMSPVNSAFPSMAFDEVRAFGNEPKGTHFCFQYCH